MLDSLTAAWKLGREWGERTGEPSPSGSQAIGELIAAWLPSNTDHIRAFRDGAKDGAAGRGD